MDIPCRFDTDDVVARIFAVADMVTVVGMSLAIPTANVHVFVSFYITIRVLLIVKYLHVWFSLKRRFMVSGFILGFSLGVASWAAMLCAGGHSSRWLFAGCALLCDYGTPFALLRWMLPVHSSHFPERLSGMIVLMFCGAP